MNNVERRRPLHGQPAIQCPVGQTLRVLGGKHRPNILHNLMHGEAHFIELTRLVQGISRKVLAEQLRELEEAGLVARVQKQDVRRRVGYSLTEKGRALGAIVSQLGEWAETYQDDPDRNGESALPD